MATHTQVGGKSNFDRKFTISRRNGQQDKNGEPYFFEWLRELPDNQTGRIFEMRPNAQGEARHYELFKALDGILQSVETSVREISGKERTMLVLKLQDGIDVYEVEIGDLDGRYALDIMKRMLHPDFDTSKKMRIAPYSIQNKDTGKWSIGVSTYSGVNKMTGTLADVPILEKCPQAVSETNRKGEVSWYFDEVGKWLFNAVSDRLQSSSASFIEAPAAIHVPIAPAQQQPARQEPDPNDLPF